MESLQRRFSSSMSNAQASENPPLGSPLSLRRVPSKNIPASDSPEYDAWVDSIFKDAQALVEELPTWTPGKVFDGVQTASRKARRGERQMWHMRKSQHDHSYEDFRPLLENHTENESKYIDAVKNVKKLHEIKPSEAAIYHNTYKQPFPISNRDFVFLILSREAPDRKSFTVVSLPVDHPDAKPKRTHVRAAYASVEHVQSLDDGKVLWQMVVTSEANGAVPASLTDKFLCQQIAQDVPAYISWLKAGSDGQKNAPKK